MSKRGDTMLGSIFEQRIDGRLPTVVFNELVAIVKTIGYDPWPQVLLAICSESSRRDEMTACITAAAAAAGVLTRHQSTQAVAADIEFALRVADGRNTEQSIIHVDGGVFTSLRSQELDGIRVPVLQRELERYNNEVLIVWLERIDCEIVLESIPELSERIEVGYDFDDPPAGTQVPALGSSTWLSAIMGRAESLGQADPEYWDLRAEEAEKLGRYDEAIRIRTECELPLYENRGDSHSAAIVRWMIGDLYQDNSVPGAAAGSYIQALSVFERFGDARASGILWYNLADLSFKGGNSVDALESYQRAAKRFEQLGDVELSTYASESIASIRATTR
jgi:tetratricopeptide (TPR) repeat protein